MRGDAIIEKVKEFLATELIEEYYPDGSIKEKSYVNAKSQKHGEYRSFFNDGSIAEDFEYLEGKYSGIFREFYRDGSKRKEITFSESGKPHQYQFWFEKQNLMKENGIRLSEIFIQKIFW